MSDAKRVVAVTGYDNRLPITADISAQLQLALSNGGYQATDVSTTVLVKATMVAPNAGMNQHNIALMVPTGTLDADVVTVVTAALNELVMPFSPTFTVVGVTVYDTTPEPTPGPPQPGAPENGNP
jgi:hypothetical protein